MSNGFYNVPKAVNEPVKEYAKGSPEPVSYTHLRAHET